MQSPNKPTEKKSQTQNCYVHPRTHSVQKNKPQQNRWTPGKQGGKERRQQRQIKLETKECIWPQTQGWWQSGRWGAWGWCATSGSFYSCPFRPRGLQLQHNRRAGSAPPLPDGETESRGWHGTHSRAHKPKCLEFVPFMFKTGSQMSWPWNFWGGTFICKTQRGLLFSRSSLL